MKLKNNLEYFWMYYKWQIIAVLVVVILGVHFLVASLSEKKCVLSIMFLDCYAMVSEEQMEQELLQALQLDKKSETVEIQNTLMIDNTETGGYAMTSLSRFLADVGSEKLDICGMLEASYLKYDEARTFCDLKTCFSEEQLLEFGDAVAYSIDGRAIGLYADHLPMLQKDGCYDAEDDRGIIGILYNAPHKELSAEYLIYLFSQTQ